jgi:small subunit ribosomal protein S7
MSRKNKSKTRIITQDPIYNSLLATMIINKILMKGKKILAQHIFYQSMKIIREKTNKDELEILQKAINNITPMVELKSRRIGGSSYSIPIEIKHERGISIALSFLIKAARKRPGNKIINKLTNEIIDAANNTGASVKKKDELHKMAEANKAFANLKF